MFRVGHPTPETIEQACSSAALDRAVATHKCSFPTILGLAVPPAFEVT
jgi:hypothetical protein